MGLKWHQIEPPLERRIKEALYEDQVRRKAQSTQPQPSVCHEPLGKTPGKEVNPTRIRVWVCSFRNRLTDPDNLCPKYFIDCLRYWKYIPDDSSKFIELSVAQLKCDKKNERTEIEIIYPD